MRRGVVWGSSLIAGWVSLPSMQRSMRVRDTRFPTAEGPLDAEAGAGMPVRRGATGVVEPAECPLFGTACTPAHPVGPCMVSAEGSCAAHYRYRGVIA